MPLRRLKEQIISYRLIFTLVTLITGLKSFPQPPQLILPIGHTKEVKVAAFSPDGKKVATGSKDNTVKIWNAETGALLHNLQLQSLYGIESVSFSPDGKKLLTLTADLFDSLPKVWSVETGNLIYQLHGHAKEVKSAVFSPDGKTILTASYDKTAKIWSAESGKLLNTLSGHNNWVISAFFSYDGRNIVTASADSTAKTWNAQSGAMLQNFKGHSGPVNLAVFTPDGGKLITASSDSSARVWNAATGITQFILKSHSDEVETVSVSPEGNKILSSTYNHSKLWNLETGKFLFDIEGEGAAFKSASFSKDGVKIVTSILSKTAIWNAKTGSLIKELKAHKTLVNTSAFSADGKKILTASMDKTVKIWDAETGALLVDLKGHTELVEAVSFNQDKNKLLTGSDDNLARIWDLKSGIPVNNFRDAGVTGIRAVAFSPDEKNVLTSGKEIARIWSVGSGKLIHELKGHEGFISYGEFSHDGKKILTASWDFTIKIWNAETGVLLLTLPEAGRINTAMFSPDGKHVLTTIDDEVARVWSSKTGKVSKTLVGHSSWIKTANFSPDGENIVTGSSDKTAKIWSAKSGNLLHDLTDHSDWVIGAYFYPDGKKVLTATRDGILRTWDVLSGVLLNTVRIEKDFEIKQIAFKQNIVVAVNESEVGIFHLNTGEKLRTHTAIDQNGYVSRLSSGYYLSSPDAAKLLHYVTGDFKYISFEQLDVKYNRPDLVLQALGNKDTALIYSYKKAYKKRIKKLGIDTTAFGEGFGLPEADFVERDNITYEQTKGQIKLRIKGQDTAYKLDRFNVWVNEAPVFGLRGISLRNKKINSFDTALTITLSDHKNIIETSVTNVNGTESYRIPLHVNYTPKEIPKEKVYFIGIGINKFKEKGHDLEWSVKDINDLADSLSKRHGSSIQVTTLFNEDVSVENILAIKKKLLNTGVNDKVILSYSGHGLLSKDFDYYLSTYNINFSSPEKGGLSYDALESLLDSIPARKKLMLIDACHSGEVDKDELVRIKNGSKAAGVKGGDVINYSDSTGLGMKNSFELMQQLFVNVSRSTGATVISAAAGTQFALEKSDLKNGVFTYSILKAMQQPGHMKVSTLKDIVGKQVEQLTNGLQKPTSRSETKYADWDVW